jgi:hypothetical protein
MLQFVSDNKALDDEFNESVRAFIRDVRDKQFDGNQSALAEKLELSPSALSELLSTRRGAGMKVLGRLSRLTGVKLDAIINYRGEIVPDDMSQVQPNDRTAIGLHRDFESAWMEFWRRLGDSGEYDADIKPACASVSFGTGLPDRIDWLFIKSIADAEMRARKLHRERSSAPRTDPKS